MINSKTKLLGLIGHPIGHSMSPAMHNLALGQMKMNYLYMAFDVQTQDLGDMVAGAKALGMPGFNVTIPHKVSIIGHLDQMSREAQLIGAVNTVNLRNDNLAVGYNTDGAGCVRALGDAGVSVKNKKIFIIGAGGAARAIGFQCALDGADLAITNRQEEAFMAEQLCHDINEKLDAGAEYIKFTTYNLKNLMANSDIIIHTTPVGMHPDIDSCAVPEEIIPEDKVIMDIVYNPIETKLLRLARERGCKTVDGVGMLVNQGAQSLKIWLGIDAPIETMRQAVIEKLL